MKQLVKLKDITSYSKGSQINGDELINDAEYDYLNGGIYPSGKWNKANCPANTITISEGGNSCGYVNFMRKPFWCGAHCYYLYDAVENTQYLYYALKSQQNRIMRLRSGACMPNIKKGDLGNFEFSFDGDVREQEKVTLTLRKLEGMIESRKQELSELDNLIKARFVEMFGSIHESTEYPYVAVKDLTDVISGGTPSRDKSEYWKDGTIPWVKTTELQNNIIVNVDEYITEAGLNGSSAKLVPVGTVLVAMYGQGKTRGMTAYLNIEACTNQACACILPSDRIDSMFMWKFFELSYEKLRSLAQGAGQPNLNGNMIKNFQVLVPPIELQKEYVDFVHQTDKSKVIAGKMI